MLHYAVLLLASGVMAQRQDGTTLEDEFARFQSGERGRVSTESDTVFSYHVLSRMRDGDLETVEAHAAAGGATGGASLDDPGYANLLVTLDHSDGAVEAFLTAADGRAFQLGRAAPPAEHHVWAAVPAGDEGGTADEVDEESREAETLAQVAVPKGEKDRSGQYVVDVFIGFSDKAAKRAGNIRAKAQSLISWTNMALRNSKVTNGRLRLVGVATSPQNPGLRGAIQQQVQWFGKAMASTGADISFAVQEYNNDGGVRGVAQGGGRRAAVLIGAGIHVFAHEAGHLSGARHCLGKGDAVRSHARYGISGTIMCYGKQPIFSTPAVRLDGKVMGIRGKADVAGGWRSNFQRMSGYARHTVPFGASPPSPPSPQPRPAPPAPAPRGGKLVAGRVYRVSVSGSQEVLQLSQGKVLLSPLSSVKRSQQWRLQARGGAYALVNMRSERCLAVQRASRAAGAPLVTWRCGILQSDKFVAVPAAGGRYLLRASHSGKCVEVTRKGSLKQADCAPGRKGQRFLFTA